MDISGDTSSQWELSKENIQPLKQGRKATVLSVALDENSAQKLSAIRHEFEEELRTYSGNDPLDVWYRYVLWVEQNYPKGGKEGNFMKLIEKCFTAVHSSTESNEKYRNDQRIMELWIKYANMCPKPHEIYQTLNKRGLCTVFAEFYVNWSWELEKSGNYRQADKIFEKGFQVAAHPSDVLQEAHKKFQMRVARSTVEGRTVNQDTDNSEPQRVALTALKSQGRKNRVAAERVGSSVIGSAGRIQQSQLSGNAQGPTFAIFQDSNVDVDSSSGQSHVNRRGALPVGEKINHENIKKATKWNKAKVNQRVVVPLEDVDKYQKPSFSVHKDESVPQPTPSKLPQTSNVLSTRKDFQDWQVELFIAEPFNPNVQPQYCKHKVYCGTEEFSFEELRAAQYFKNEKEERKRMEELSELKEKLRKQEEMIQMLLKQQLSKEEISSRIVFQDSWVAINKSVNASVNASNFLDESSTRALLQCQPEVPCLSSKESPVVQDPTPVKSGRDDSNLSTNSTSKTFNMTDPTVETKKALKVVDDMFCQSFGNSDTQQESSSCLEAPTEAVEKDGSPFTIYQDENNTKNPEHKDESAPFQIYTEDSKDEKPVPFQIYSDAPIGTKSNQLPNLLQESTEVTEPKVSRLEDPNDQYPEVQDENCPPAGVEQPHKSRPISGILQPASDIPVLSLDQRDDHHQPKDVPKNSGATEFSEISDGLDDIVPLDGTLADFTLKMPSNLEAFAKNAKIASTPAPWAVQPAQEHSNFNDTDSNHFPLIKYTEEEEDGEEKKENSGDLMPPPASHVSHPHPPSSPNPAPPKNGLSPIMEASREYVSSSSSSSGYSTTSTTLGGQSIYGGMHHISRSRHNSNSHPEAVHETGIAAQADFTKSGYLADKSRGESLVDSKPNIITSQIGHQKDDQDYLVFDTEAAAMLDMDFQQPPPAQTPRVNSKEPKATLPKVGKSRFPEIINPFADEILSLILTNLEEPLEKRGGFVALKGSLPPIRMNSQVSLGRELFHIRRLSGEGAYAKAYLSSTMDPLNVTIMPADSDDEDEEKQIILKVQSPACPWEFYICHELRERLKTRSGSPLILDSVMRINRGYFSANQSVLVNQYHKYGTLLDAVNGFRTSGQPMPELLAVYYMVEVLSILEALHLCSIIHADVKPDNFLIRDLPQIDTSATTPSEVFAKCPNSLKLIDFGRSIDLEKFPEGTTFTEVVTTDKFTCCEMREGRPWTYQTDLYGAAAVAHLLLFGSYMEVKKLASGKWDISGVTLKRYWQKEMWQELFSTLLNVPSCDKMPNLATLKKKLMTTFYEEGFHKQINSKSSSLLMMLKKHR